MCLGNPIRGKIILKFIGIPIDKVYRNAYNEDVLKRYTNLTHKLIRKEQEDG